MPRISEFFGITIFMYFNDHAPPHFHAEYGEFEAAYAVDTIEVLRGGLPRRAHSMVVEWTTLHRLELKTNWDQGKKRQTIGKDFPA